MKPAVIILIALLFQEVPFKPKEEFEIKLDYQFKPRPQADDRNTVTVSGSQTEYDRRLAKTPLPYLILNVNVLKLSTDEVRIRVENNASKLLFTKRAQQGMTIPVDLGFTDDVKDRVSPHLYTISFMSGEKKDLSKIVIEVAEDGAFFVNGEKRGKF